MSTIVNQAVTAITAALQSAPAVSANIGRVSLRPMAQASLQGVVVRPLAAELIQVDIGGNPISWNTQIAVECYARSTGSSAPDQSVDTLLEQVYTRLMADPTLGGAVVSLQPNQLHYDFDADGDKTACATLVFHAQQRASAGSFS